jgi:hypothetical protein
MVTETTTAKVTLHQRAMHELKQLVLISLDEALGEGRLTRMFFIKRGSV